MSSCNGNLDDPTLFKKDWEVIRDIMLELDSTPDFAVMLAGVDEACLNRHLALLTEWGLVHRGGTQLTAEGRALLEKIRDDLTWAWIKTISAHDNIALSVCTINLFAPRPLAGATAHHPVR